MMQPLLEIKTTRAKYEYEMASARLEISQEKATVDRRTQRATINMRRQAGRLEMNTTARRSDMGFKGVVARATYEADRGQKAALEATAAYAELGNAVANIQSGANIPDALWNQIVQRSQGDLMLVPVSPIDIKYVPAELMVDFQPGQLSADWDVGKARLDFVPGSFKLNFSQYASIDIQYTGGPIYAPPSANPNFEAVV